MEVVPVVVGALSAVSKRLNTWLDKLRITINTGLPLKTALLGRARIFKEGIGKLKEKSQSKGSLAIGYGSLPWCNVVTTSTRAEAFRL